MPPRELEAAPDPPADNGANRQQVRGAAREIDGLLAKSAPGRSLLGVSLRRGAAMTLCSYSTEYACQPGALAAGRLCYRACRHVSRCLKGVAGRVAGGRERPRGAICLLYTSPSPRDVEESRMPSSA